MLCTLSFIPKPAVISAPQPAIPITVIKKRFLYRNIFLIVTFLVNDICFHINVCSRRIFLPLFGALGRIRTDGSSESS